MMRHRLCIFIVIMLLISTSACSNKSSEPMDLDIQTEDPISTEPQSTPSSITVTTPCSKASVDAFMAAFSKRNGEGLLTGYSFDEEHCYNVTPLSVSCETDIQIFKFSDSCASFALIDGEVFEICNFFGGFGFVNAVPWDYDNDGNLDLLIASSWGSGLHRSEISVFNTKTKESIVIYDTSATDDPSVDLIVVTSALALSSADPQNLPKQYLVFSADIEAQNNNLADLSCVETSIVGTVLVKNGVPEFIPIEQ